MHLKNSVARRTEAVECCRRLQIERQKTNVWSLRVEMEVGLLVSLKVGESRFQSRKVERRVEETVFSN